MMSRPSAERHGRGPRPWLGQPRTAATLDAGPRRPAAGTVEAACVRRGRGNVGGRHGVAALQRRAFPAGLSGHSVLAVEDSISLGSSSSGLKHAISNSGGVMAPPLAVHSIQIDGSIFWKSSCI